MGAALWKQISSAHGSRSLNSRVVPMALTRSMSMPDKDRFEDCVFDNSHESLVTQAWIGNGVVVVTMAHVHHC